MNPETPVPMLFGIPKDYVFLLAGMAIGFLLGWLAARLTSGSTREIGQDVEPAVSTPIQTGGGQAISMVVNRKTVDLDPAQATEIQALIGDRKMIEAIKRLRTMTGLGLAEAKAVADSLARIRH